MLQQSSRNIMKIAVLSDIHANLHAFEAVLKDARRRGADGFFCLGDIVGYGAQPEECVQLVRSIGAVTVKGNHDVWALQPVAMPPEETAPTAISGMDCTKRRSTKDSRDWLRQLPYTAQAWGVACTHGSFHQPEKWGYLDTPNEAAASFRRQPTRTAFYGHTHAAGFWQEGGDRFIPAQPKTCTFRLGPNFRYALNPGSVGNPRTPIHQPDPRAQYMIYDTDKFSATFIRVAYNIKACIAVMKAAGLSEEMMARMELGY